MFSIFYLLTKIWRQVYLGIWFLPVLWRYIVNSTKLHLPRKINVLYLLLCFSNVHNKIYNNLRYKRNACLLKFFQVQWVAEKPYYIRKYVTQGLIYEFLESPCFVWQNYLMFVFNTVNTAFFVYWNILCITYNKYEINIPKGECTSMFFIVCIWCVHLHRNKYIYIFIRKMLIRTRWSKNKLWVHYHIVNNCEKQQFLTFE